MNIQTRGNSHNVHHHQQQQHHLSQQRNPSVNNVNHNSIHHSSSGGVPNRNTSQNLSNGINRPHRQNQTSQHQQLQGSVHNNNSNSNHHAQAISQRQPQQQLQRQQNHHQQGNLQNQGAANRPASTTASATQNNNQAPNNAPPLPQVLPKGWKKEEIVRTKGISSGIVDVVYVPSASSEQTNPELVGKKFTNKLELQRFFGDKYDMSLLDYKSGKVSQVVWRKQRRLKNIANTNNILSASKYDTYLNLPIRQTASIFKQPVNVVTNNHRNEPTPANLLNSNAPNQQQGSNNSKSNEKPKPVQLFWELRFNGLKSVDPKYDGDENIQDEFEMSKLAKFKNFPLSTETALRSVAVSCYLNPNKILLGQDKEFSKNARVFIDRDQPLIPAVNIKEEDVKLQEAKLKEMRKQLELALHDFENMDFEEYLLETKMSPLEQELVKNGVKKLKIDNELNDEVIIEDDEKLVNTKLEPKIECSNDGGLIAV